MSYIITFLIGAALGTVAGLLVYRKHSGKAQAFEAKGKSLLDILKGR